MSLYTVILSYLGEHRVKQVIAPSHFEVSAEISNSKVKPVDGALNAWQQSLSLEDGTALLTIIQTIEKGSKR
jgi:hypothetical protein